jgi:hypothetical protein
MNEDEIDEIKEMNKILDEEIKFNKLGMILKFKTIKIIYLFSQFLIIVKTYLNKIC